MASTRTKVEGITALRKRVDELAKVADKTSKAQGAKLAADLLINTARGVRDDIRNAANQLGWPRATVKSVFAFGDLRAEELPRTVRASLVGVRKGAPPRKDEQIYKEWHARGDNKSPRKKAGGGTLIGMSLAAMYEFGTTKLQARPAFRFAYNLAKPKVRQDLIAGYKNIIESFNR